MIIGKKTYVIFNLARKPAVYLFWMLLLNFSIVKQSLAEGNLFVEKGTIISGLDQINGLDEVVDFQILQHLEENVFVQGQTIFSIGDQVALSFQQVVTIENVAQPTFLEVKEREFLDILNHKQAQEEVQQQAITSNSYFRPNGTTSSRKGFSFGYTIDKYFFINISTSAKVKKAEFLKFIALLLIFGWIVKFLLTTNFGEPQVTLTIAYFFSRFNRPPPLASIHP
jgi:hypothetical protein